jgi:hypothetical protein
VGQQVGMTMDTCMVFKICCNLVEAWRYAVGGKLKTNDMQNSNIVKRDLRTSATISIATGFFILLFSFIGHILTPGKLIPTSFIGGTFGIIAGTYICFRQNNIDKVKLLPVMLCNLYVFGLVSFVTVFNFDKPYLILFCFLFFGLATLIISHNFHKIDNFSKNRFFGVIGLLFSFPALYFIVASILKFQLGYSFLFSSVDAILTRPNGQTNFNAITPFLFGGGLLLSFMLNFFTEFRIQKTDQNILHYKISGLSGNFLNLFVLLFSGIVGLIIIAYLAVENLM